ncbi:MAG TPA: ester cyclase [Rubrobacter sp.]|nr:ester cyclase [Rubrobacter sp.]
MSEENKDLAQRSWELVNQHSFDALAEVYAADALIHEPDRDLQSLEEAKHYIGTYFDAFPDLRFTVDDILGEGDLVATRWTLRGTHEGEMEELGPPTGRRVELEGITVHRIEGGKIVEEWECYDNLGFLQQLGLIPAEASTG